MDERLFVTGFSLPLLLPPVGLSLGSLLVTALAAGFVVVVVVLVIGGLSGASKRRRARAGGYAMHPELEPNALAELRSQAGPALLQADEAVRTGRQERDFASAAYGEKEIADFSRALDAAEESLSQAFARQQLLDDEKPDTPQEQYDWLQEILERSRRITQELSSQESVFSRLRELERNVPDAVTQIRQEVTRLRQDLEGAGQIQETLQREYAPTAVAQVRDNVAQAAGRLDFADQAAHRAEGEQSGEATLTVREAQAALAQARQLVGAVTHARQNLERARSALDEELVAGLSDVALARSAVATRPELAPLADSVEAEVARVRERLAGSDPVDPLALQDELAAVRKRLSGPVAELRDARERDERAQQELAGLLSAVTARVQGTEEFVNSRRGAVGPEARTRLAEAKRYLGQAQATASRPAGEGGAQQALSDARRADELARQASAIAGTDVDQFSADARSFGGYGPYGMGRGFGSPGRGLDGMNTPFGSGMGGAVLGGIVLGSMFGQGGRAEGDHGTWDFGGTDADI